MLFRSIAHCEDIPAPFGTRGPPRLVLDVLLHATAPHEPQEVTARFAAVLKDYGLHKVTGDRYAAEWVVSAFAKCDIRYEASELSASEIYVNALPAFSERRVRLIDNAKLLTELRLLERKARTGGRGDSIDHPRGAHDDLAIAACGALWQAASAQGLGIWERLGMSTAEFQAQIEKKTPEQINEEALDAALRNQRAWIAT